MYKTILVHVDSGDPGSAGRVQVATALAHEWHAKVIGVAAALPAVEVAMLASGGAAIAGGVLVEEEHELDDRFILDKAQFASGTDGTDVQTQWRTAVGFPAECLADLAACADLLIVGPEQRSSASNGYLDYADLVMRAGRPVLVVPHGVGNLSQSHAVVAWRNTRESRRAVADALPLLIAYGSVSLLHVRERGDRPDNSLADVQAHLEAHCIGAAIKTAEVGQFTTAGLILDFAERSQADLIVCGAYGHTRVREWAFGGVTRELFKGSPIACLFSR